MRPQKTNISIDELVQQVERGEIKLPEMQRPYVWRATQVRDLLDSLYREYPSGTILVWQIDENIETRDFAIEQKDEALGKQKLLLLDGQQRITSLFALLCGKEVQVRGRQKPIDLLFNLEHPNELYEDVVFANDQEMNNDNEEDDYTEGIEPDEEQKKTIEHRTFTVFTNKLNASPHWVRVSEILGKEYLESQILKSKGLTSDDSRWDKYSSRLQKLRRVRYYEYAMYVLPQSMPYEEVAEVFVRTNSKGTRLRGSDLALAQITSKWKGFLSEFEAFAEGFGDNKQYMIDTNIPVRALVIFVTRQCQFKKVGMIPVDELKNSWITAKQGIEFAVNFIKNNSGTDVLSHLSSPFLMVPIAVYWVLDQRHGDSQITPEERDKLMRWFYLAHSRGHYSRGASESILDADLNILFRTEDKSEALDRLIEQLRQRVGRFNILPEDVKSQRTGHPLFAMLRIIMKKTGMKDWHYGTELSDSNIGSEYQIEHHHIFPKSLLMGREYNRYEINEIANFTFLIGGTNRKIFNKEPKVYFQELLDKHGEEALTSHLIPLDKNLWELDNYRDFLSYRRKAIADKINEFIEDLN
ncbi:MAG: DUF262 domain-containing protein [Candidatus Spechtbacteria bacterium SB0662_bin_43]|uniref:DUF262 domain-containing protein n=1 Tax=Candidatus Spechtbacteria bacterium SB0662_bin_43 TaxID=2604897 RepID=A0A845DB65_9BACT|nr:DUF262 domain-containing protein [Candidatus Spechtbacteria bacterium SB0662_bin_43]